MGCWGHPRVEWGTHSHSVPRGTDGTAIFAMSDQKDVALEIHVTNLPSDPAEPQRDGDDAHEAMLTATFPPELPYSALRPYDGRASLVRWGSGGGGRGRLGCSGGGTEGAGGRGWSWGCWGCGMGSDLGMQRDWDSPGGAGDGEGWGRSSGCRRMRMVLGMGLVPGVQERVSARVQQAGGNPQQQGLSSLPPQDKPVVCLANQNGSQVECELGNPMKRGAQVGAAPRCPQSLVPGPGPSPHPSAPRCGSSSSSAPWASPSRPRTWRWSLPCPREPWGGRGPPRQSPTLGSVCLQWGLGVMPPLIPPCLVPRISEQPGLEPVVARARVVIELPLSVTG